MISQYGTTVRNHRKVLKAKPTIIARTATAVQQQEKTADDDTDAFFLQGGFDIANPRVTFRPATAQDVPACYHIESASYPADEAASMASLEYRQAHAGPYFQCATVISKKNAATDNDGGDTEDNMETVIGYVCATRCNGFDEASMSTHTDTGKILAIHSVVVEQPYRRQGLATSMLKHYLATIQHENNNNDNASDDDVGKNPIQSIMLIAKQHLLGFYVQCGFSVNCPSPIVHGTEQWYELEQKMQQPRLLRQTRPLEGEESWFCKTEQFIKPFPEVRPHLEAHKRWVSNLRQEQHKCVSSGYRVDADGKPGGGGLMFLAAKSYNDALDLVLQDPLVANGCVEWELNGWIGEVGDLELR